MSNVIRFHLKSGPYGWLSNFAAYNVMIDGMVWPTSEHFYQASKFINDPDWMEAIRGMARPYDAWRMGRSPDHPRRVDWDNVKDDVMLRAVRSKFSQHDNLRRYLIATGDAILVEHSPRDTYWGDGGDGTGLNRLGEILMRVRSDFLIGVR
jgi:ribA/ribD-fused uncharacterized protein